MEAKEGVKILSKTWKVIKSLPLFAYRAYEIEPFQHLHMLTQEHFTKQSFYFSCIYNRQQCTYVVTSFSPLTITRYTAGLNFGFCASCSLPD